MSDDSGRLNDMLSIRLGERGKCVFLNGSRQGGKLFIREQASGFLGAEPPEAVS